MFEADIAALVAVAVGIASFAAIVVVFIRRWRQGAPATQQAVEYRPSASDTEWRARLERLNFLLARVQSADTGDVTLPSELAGKLSRYFGGHLEAPPAPADPDEVMRRVLLLSGWVSEIQAASLYLEALPAQTAQLVADYVRTSQRELG